MKPKVLISVNTAWNLVNYRAGLIRALMRKGYEVIAVAPHDRYVSQLQALGCRYISIPMDNQGKNPVRDALLFFRYLRILIRERPAVYLGYTIKPNIYGSLAAHLVGVPVINNIAGLGAAFMKSGWLNRLARILYRLALAKSYRVFFQNADDRELFETGKLVGPKKSDRVPGSGVDLSRFTPSPLLGGEEVKFLLIARMLWDKGVGEYVEAARMLRRRGVKAEFGLLGFLEVQNPSAISRSQMDEWVKEGVVNYLGTSDDVRHEIALADCVVLPSYREGTPRTLLEAAALGRPVVTTDAVGCRDVIDNHVSGYLCRPGDAADLAEKLAMVVALTPRERSEMGISGRAKMEREYDEQIVINKYFDAIAGVLEDSRQSNKQE